MLTAAALVNLALSDSLRAGGGKVGNRFSSSFSWILAGFRIPSLGAAFLTCFLLLLLFV